MKKLLFSLIGIVFLLNASPTFAKSDNASSNSNQSCTTIQSGTLLNSAGKTITTGFDEWGYNYQGKTFVGNYCDAYRDAAWCQPYKEDYLMMKWNDAWLSNQDCDGDGLLDRHYGFDSYIGSGAWLTNHQSGTYEGEEIISWNVTGNWSLDFAGGTANREFRNLVQDEFGNVSGEFWWFNGSNWYYGGTLVGNVIGDILTLHYDRNPDYDYTGDFMATISETGLINGTFTDSHGGNYTWIATGVDAAVYETCSWNYFVKIIAVPEDAYPDSGIWYSADGVEIGPIIWGEFATTQEVSNDSCTGDHGLLYKSPVRAGLGNW